LDTGGEQNASARETSPGKFTTAALIDLAVASEPVNDIPERMWMTGQVTPTQVADLTTLLRDWIRV
jgi:hypothetical protein